MAAKLTDINRGEMFQAFCKKQTCAFVAKVCGISETTCRNYRRIDHWDDRLLEIRRKAQKKTDKKQVDYRVRHAKLGQLLQKKGADYFLGKIDEAGKRTGREIKDEGCAVRAIGDGVDIERDASGAADRLDLYHHYNDMTDEELRRRLEELKQQGRAKKSSAKSNNSK